MLEMFLESDLFSSVVENKPQKDIEKIDKKEKIEAEVDNALPDLIRKYGQIVCVSVNIQNISLEMVEEEKQKLFICI